MRSRIFGAALLAAAAAQTPAETAAPPAQVVIDETTERVLLDACAYLRSAEQFAVRFDITYDEVLGDGTKVQYSRANEVIMVRPDRLRVDVEDDRGLRTVYFDGKTVTVHRPAGGVYAQTEAPETLDAALDLAEAKGITLPLDDLLYSQPCAGLAEHLRTGTYAGLHYVDGDWYDHLLLATDRVDVQLWVAPGDAPVIRKVLITYRDAPGAPQYEALLSGWDFAPGIDEGLFRFEPPEGARKIAFLTSRASQEGGEQ